MVVFCFLLFCLVLLVLFHLRWIASPCYFPFICILLSPFIFSHCIISIRHCCISAQKIFNFFIWKMGLITRLVLPVRSISSHRLFYIKIFFISYLQMECLEFIRKYNLESSTIFSPWNSGNRAEYFEQEEKLGRSGVNSSK